LNFRDARLKLLAYIRSQIRNGELTERGFARLIGISQPHAHNVLKGVRNLSPEVLDLALKYLHLSLLDLAGEDELSANLQSRRAPPSHLDVPFLDGPIGPGAPWPLALSSWKKFPLPFTTAGSSSNVAMAKLIFDPAMQSALGLFDVALLDTSATERGGLDPQGIFVIERANEAVLRYIRAGSRACYLPTSATLDHPDQWEQLAIPMTELSSSVKARVRWLGRERHGNQQIQTGRFLYDPISS
jgi:transcriptional regulator with XRE-family HTH domain